MNASDLQLWNIVIPTHENDQVTVTPDQVTNIGDFIVDTVGGYSLPFDKRLGGVFKNADGDLLNEESAVIQVAANLEQVSKIACFIKGYLNQESVMFYQVSPHAFFV